MMPERLVDILPFKIEDRSLVIDLWNRCNLVRPQNDPARDIDRKMRVNPELFLLAWVEGKLIGSVMAGYEGHRGWVNYLAVDPDYRLKGIGRMLMQQAEMKLRDMGCSKINLQIRSTNQAVIAFYKSIGFGIDDVTSMGKRLEVD